MKTYLKDVPLGWNPQTAPREPYLPVTVCTAPHHHIPRAVATEVGMDILGEGSGHGKGILGAQDHRAWAPGDSWGWMGGKGGQTYRVSTGPRL